MVNWWLVDWCLLIVNCWLQAWLRSDGSWWPTVTKQFIHSLRSMIVTTAEALNTSTGHPTSSWWSWLSMSHDQTPGRKLLHYICWFWRARSLELVQQILLLSWLISWCLITININSDKPLTTMIPLWLFVDGSYHLLVGSSMLLRAELELAMKAIVAWGSPVLGCASNQLTSSIHHSYGCSSSDCKKGWLLPWCFQFLSQKHPSKTMNLKNW